MKARNLLEIIKLTITEIKYSQLKLKVNIRFSVKTLAAQHNTTQHGTEQHSTNSHTNVMCMAKTSIHPPTYPSIHQLLSFVPSLILSIIQHIAILHSLTSRGNLEQLVNLRGVCVRMVGRNQNMVYIGPVVWQLPVLA